MATATDTMAGDPADDAPSTFRSTLSQVVGALAFGSVIMSVGLIFGMPTVVIGELERPDARRTHGFALDKYASSWFGSILFISQPLGSLCSGFLQDVFGRKKCMLIVNIPQLVGWLMLYSSTSVSMLYAAVTVMGLSVGFMEAPVLSYIGEITEPRLRGVLSSIAGIFLNVGIMLECYIGAFTHWRTLVLVSGLGPVLCFLALLLVPESPAWLVYKGRVREAEAALCWLRGWTQPQHVSRELASLVEHVGGKGGHRPAPRIVKTIGNDNGQYKQVPAHDMGEMGVVDGGGKSNRGVGRNLRNFLKPNTLRPLKLILIYFFCSHCASLIGLRPFLVNIFDSMNMPVEPKWVVVMVGTLQVLGSLGCMVVMRPLGKRGLSFLSMTTCVVCSAAISAYILLGAHSPAVPMVLFCLLFFAAQLGIGSMPWILISEVFPIEGRGMAGGVSAACGYGFIFVVTKSYIYLEQWFALRGALLCYGAVGLWGIGYLYFCMPETEGKTLAEIEQFFLTRSERQRLEAGKQVATATDA